MLLGLVFPTLSSPEADTGSQLFLSPHDTPELYPEPQDTSSSLCLILPRAPLKQSYFPVIKCHKDFVGSQTHKGETRVVISGFQICACLSRGYLCVALNLPKHVRLGKDF